MSEFESNLLMLMKKIKQTMSKTKAVCSIALLAFTTLLLPSAHAGKYSHHPPNTFSSPPSALEPREWLQNTVSPLLFDVSQQTELDWRFMSPQYMRDGDCITIEFTNPYADDAPLSYSSFDQQTPFTCSVSPNPRARSNLFLSCSSHPATPLTVRRWDRKR